MTTTVATADEARTLARALVEAKLAACVQMLPAQSTFRWNDAIEQADEHMLLRKIVESDFPAIARAIRALHSYDVPEIVATPIIAGDAPYLSWLTDAVARP